MAATSAPRLLRPRASDLIAGCRLPNTCNRTYATERWRSSELPEWSPLLSSETAPHGPLTAIYIGFEFNKEAHELHNKLTAMYQPTFATPLNSRVLFELPWAHWSTVESKLHSLAFRHRRFDVKCRLELGYATNKPNYGSVDLVWESEGLAQLQGDIRTTFQDILQNMAFSSTRLKIYIRREAQRRHATTHLAYRPMAEAEMILEDLKAVLAEWPKAFQITGLSMQGSERLNDTSLVGSKSWRRKTHLDMRNERILALRAASTLYFPFKE